jgi:hypothetical protein
MKTLPAAMNAKHTASHNLLATTIETTLLKLSLVRSRLRSAIYNYASPSTQGVTVSQAIVRLHEKLVARERATETQERDVHSRLKEYEQLLELVDGTGGGFAQVVKDLATVKRETEECRKDLRWTHYFIEAGQADEVLHQATGLDRELTNRIHFYVAFATCRRV